MSWHFLERWLEKANQHSTLLGKFWITFLIVCRMIVIGSLGDRVYADEQSEFRCNTAQPGCNNVCFNAFSPISHLRFWGFQIVIVTFPTIIFLIYSGHKTKEKMDIEKEKREEKREKEKLNVAIEQASKQEVGIMKEQEKQEKFRQKPTGLIKELNDIKEMKQEIKNGQNGCQFSPGGKKNNEVLFNEHDFDNYIWMNSNAKVDPDFQVEMTSLANVTQYLQNNNFDQHILPPPAVIYSPDDKLPGIPYGGNPNNSILCNESAPYNYSTQQTVHFPNNQQQYSHQQSNNNNQTQFGNNNNQNTANQNTFEGASQFTKASYNENNNSNKRYETSLNTARGLLNTNNNNPTDLASQIQQRSTSQIMANQARGSVMDQARTSVVLEKKARKAAEKEVQQQLSNPRIIIDKTISHHFTLYFSSVILRLISETVFLYLQYLIFGFHVPEMIKCSEWPCPGNFVDCFISRPQEKTIFLNFMFGFTCVCIMLNLLEVIYLMYVVWQKFTLASKVSKMRKERRARKQQRKRKIDSENLDSDGSQLNDAQMSQYRKFSVKLNSRFTEFCIIF